MTSLLSASSSDSIPLLQFHFQPQRRRLWQRNTHYDSATDDDDDDVVGDLQLRGPCLCLASARIWPRSISISTIWI